MKAKKEAIQQAVDILTSAGVQHLLITTAEPAIYNTDIHNLSAMVCASIESDKMLLPVSVYAIACAMTKEGKQAAELSMKITETLKTYGNRTAPVQA